MQTLGLSSSTPRTEGRLKALFWPAIHNDGDFDYITEQGFWVCLIVAAVTIVSGAFDHALLASVFEGVFYAMAGLGVRQRSRLAALTAFLAFFLDILVLQKFAGHGFNFVRLTFLAILLSNIRGIWFSSKWAKNQPVDTAATPIRLNQTFFDKLSDQLPAKLWPKLKWTFRAVAAVEIGVLLIALTTPLPPG